MPLYSPNRVFDMQHERNADNKRKNDTVDANIITGVSEGDFMFIQVIDEYPFNYVVQIDALQDTIIYEDLLEFEKSNVTIQMNNYDPESLYVLYEGNAVHPDRYAAWSRFIHDTVTRKNLEKSKHITLNRDSLHEIQKARWFVCVCLR